MPEPDLLVQTEPTPADAEAAALGAMLLSSGGLSAGMQRLKATDFADTKHVRIFEAFEELIERGQPVDVVTVARTVAPGISPLYVHGLTESVPVTSSGPHYVKMVAENAILRDLVATARTLVNRYGKALPADPMEALDEAEELFATIDRRDLMKTVMAHHVVDRAMEQVELGLQMPDVFGISTGFPTLDLKIGGLWPGNVILLAARPSVGKSALALNVATNVAKAGHKVLFVSLEMSAEEIGARLLCALGDLSWSKVRSGDLDEFAMSRLSNAVGAVDGLPLEIIDATDLTPRRLRSRLLHRRDIRLLVVDYLQLMSSGKDRDSRQQEVADISRSMKVLAKELEVPVLALSQLSRAGETREDKEPRLSDLRDSGALEQDADIVLFLHGEGDSVKVILAKNRMGEKSSWRMNFVRKFTRFEEAYGGLGYSLGNGSGPVGDDRGGGE